MCTSRRSGSCCYCSRWDEDYAFISELSEAIEQCKIEVNEYLNGKHAPDNQVDMFEGYEVEAEVITSKSA